MVRVAAGLTSSPDLCNLPSEMWLDNDRFCAGRVSVCGFFLRNTTPPITAFRAWKGNRLDAFDHAAVESTGDIHYRKHIHDADDDPRDPLMTT